MVAFFFWKSIVGWPTDDLNLLLHSSTTSDYITHTWEEPGDTDYGGTVWSNGATYCYRLPNRREIEQSIEGEGRLKSELRELSEPYPIRGRVLAIKT